MDQQDEKNKQGVSYLLVTLWYLALFSLLFELITQKLDIKTKHAECKAKKEALRAGEIKERRSKLLSFLLHQSLILLVFCVHARLDKDC